MLSLAAVLMVVAGVAHSYLGERGFLPRLLAMPDLPLLRRGDRGFYRARHSRGLAPVESLLVVRGGRPRDYGRAARKPVAGNRSHPRWNGLPDRAWLYLLRMAASGDFDISRRRGFDRLRSLVIHPNR